LTSASEGASGSAGRTESTFTSNRQRGHAEHHDRLAAWRGPWLAKETSHVPASRPSRSWPAALPGPWASARRSVQ